MKKYILYVFFILITLIIGYRIYSDNTPSAMNEVANNNVVILNKQHNIRLEKLSANIFIIGSKKDDIYIKENIIKLKYNKKGLICIQINNNNKSYIGYDFKNKKTFNLHSKNQIKGFERKYQLNKTFIESQYFFDNKNN